MSESVESKLFHEPPEGLGDAGLQVWRDITGVYELRPDELVTLEDICLTSDMIEALNEAWVADGKPMTTKGSMGQQVIHPMVGEIRTQRMARNALWRQLKLPEVDAPAAGAEPNQHRSAADSRWSQRSGA
jgi:hypothetical protein